MTARVLVAGAPRSGTTWVGRVLGETEGASYVHEPDNHLVRPEAWWAKRDLGSYPRLGPGEEAPEYERLFSVAFAGGPRATLSYSSARLVHRFAPRPGRRAPGGAKDAGWVGGGTARLARGLAHRRRAHDPAGPVVVKSIFCARSLEWLADRFDPQVVLVVRHPFAIIGSWADLGWTAFLDRDPAAAADCVDAFGVAPPPPDAPWINRAAWHCGFLTSSLGRAVARHPEWHVVPHEMLCAEPEAGFRRLCSQLGLRFGARAQEFLHASNRPGRAYSTNRVWAEQVDAARDRLSPADQERVLDVLGRFPLAGALGAAAPTVAPSGPPRREEPVHTQRWGTRPAGTGSGPPRP